MTDLVESARMSTLHLRLWRPICKAIASGFVFLLGTVRVRGKYRVPQKGGLLILSNHLSDLDPIVVQVVCPRPVHFMAKSELFEMRILGRLLRGFGSFPVKRGEPDRGALKTAAQLLKDGDAVVVFPEGEISESGDLLELKSGIALIIRLAAGVPVICCGIQHTQLTMPYGKVVPRPAFHHMDAVWGEAITFGKDDTAEEILGWATAQLKQLTHEGE